MKKWTTSLVMVFATGCASVSGMPTSIETNVVLSKNNFKIVKANAEGGSSGAALLGLIPFHTASYAEAKQNLLNNNQIDLESRPLALVNVTHDRYYYNFLLFMVTRIQVTADVIEFTGDK